MNLRTKLLIILVVIVLVILSSLVILDKLETHSQTYTCFGSTWQILKGSYYFDGTRYHDNTCEWIDIEECYNENKSDGPFEYSKWDRAAIDRCLNEITK